MIMSRRKQPRPKLFSETDKIPYFLPNELQFDEKLNIIRSRVNLKKHHCFGPFPTIVHIDDEIECFQLLNIKHNWLAHCSSINNSSENLNLIFQDNQLFAIATESISIDTPMCSNKVILPKLNMNKDIQIKEEPIEREDNIKTVQNKSYPCETCGIRFRQRNTLDAHRQHYCTKRETRKSHSTDSSILTKGKSMKRKSPDNTDCLSSPTKRLVLLSNDNYCQECDISFNKTDNLLQHKLHYCPRNSSSSKIKNKTLPFDHPVQIGDFIYVPIPILPSENDNRHQDNKPLDLSKPKKTQNEGINSNIPLNSPMDLSNEKSKKIVQQQELFHCDYCSIHFRSLKTLHAHQQNYCIGYRKQKKHDTNRSINTTDPIRSQSPSLSINSKPHFNDSLNSNHRSTLFICRLCQYRGHTLRGMRVHLRYHLSNNELCSDSDIMIKSITKEPSLPSTTNQFLLKCNICSAMFDYEETLLNHIKYVHTNEMFLKCLQCQSRFCSKWNLIRHMKLSHTNLKHDEQEQDKSTESFLDKNTKSFDRMNLIIDDKSTDKISLEKKFSCLFCHIKFRSMDTLQQHMTNYCLSRPETTTLQDYIDCLSSQLSFQRKTFYDEDKIYHYHQTHDKLPA